MQPGFALMENLQFAFSASYILILVLFTLLNIAMWRDGSAIRDDRFSHRATHLLVTLAVPIGWASVIGVLRGKIHLDGFRYFRSSSKSGHSCGRWTCPLCISLGEIATHVAYRASLSARLHAARCCLAMYHECSRGVGRSRARAHRQKGAGRRDQPIERPKLQPQAVGGTIASFAAGLRRAAHLNCSPESKPTPPP
jgi:hypothetical protein